MIHVNSVSTGIRAAVLPIGLLALASVVGCRQDSADSTELAGAVTQTSAAANRPALPSQAELKQMVDEALDYTEHRRELNVETQAAWQILHGVLAYGRDFTMRHGDEKVNVLDWVFAGKPMKGWTMEPGQVGLRATIEPGKNGQGHEDQWLAVISQCGVPTTQTIKVGDEEFTMYDLLKQAMYDCYEGKESSWTLIALSKYLDPIDQKWTARDGEEWSLERLAGMEAGPAYDQEAGEYQVNEGACGGTHRVIGLAMALNRYRQLHPDRKLTGGWLAAQQRIDWAIQQAKNNQLPSGAFSILYFQRPANSGALGEHLASTGHTLEFLSTALPASELKKPWVERAVVYLCKLLDRSKKLDLECGALYHAAHGLVLYRERVFNPKG